MKRHQRRIATMLAAALLSLPVSGCSARDPAGQAMFRTLLGVGAAVGTYYLVEQLK